MAEPQGTVVEDTTDAELSKMWESSNEPEATVVAESEPLVKVEEVKSDVAETPAVEQPVEETPEEEKELTQAERSKLGRNVKGLKDQVAELKAQIASMLDKSKPLAESEDFEVPEVISTPEDIRRVIQADKQREAKSRAQYEQGYMTQINTLQVGNEDLHDEVFAEMMANFNVQHSDNASADARINYAEAKASVLSKKYATPKVKVPERATASKAPVQPAAGSSRSATKGMVMPHLDEEAEKYVVYLKKQGMSDEDIMKELQ